MSDFDRVFRRREGSMSVEEAEKFDEELLQNKSLAEEYATQEKEEKLLSFLAEEEFGDYMRSLAEKGKVTETKTSAKKVDLQTKHFVKRRMLILATAASFLIFILALGNFYYNKSVPQNIATAQKLYELPLLNLEGVRTEGDYNYYLSLLNSKDKSKIASAVTYFKTQINSIPVAHYLIGHGEFYLEKYQLSQASFDTYLSLQKNGLYQEQAEYYRIVSLIAAGDYTAARNSLQYIKEGHPYEKYLPEIIQTLDNLEG